MFSTQITLVLNSMWVSIAQDLCLKPIMMALLAMGDFISWLLPPRHPSNITSNAKNTGTAGNFSAYHNIQSSPQCSSWYSNCHRSKSTKLSASCTSQWWWSTISYVNLTIYFPSIRHSLGTRNNLFPASHKTHLSCHNSMRHCLIPIPYLQDHCIIGKWHKLEHHYHQHQLCHPLHPLAITTA